MLIIHARLVCTIRTVHREFSALGVYRMQIPVLASHALTPFSLIIPLVHAIVLVSDLFLLILRFAIASVAFANIDSQEALG